jgi:hypothetical protein
MPTKRQPPSSDASIPTEDQQLYSTLYETLFSFFLHQDQLYWSSTQLLLAIQAGVLASGYTLRKSWLGPAILIAGAFITLLLFFLVLKYEWDRDVNLHILDKLARDLLPRTIKDELLKEGRKEPFIRLSATPPRWLRFIRGRYIIRSILIGLILVDALFAFLYLWTPSWF